MELHFQQEDISVLRKRGWAFLLMFDHVEHERMKPMSKKKTAILTMKLSFCIAMIIVIWVQPAALSAKEGTAIFCPPHCKPTGQQFCICS